MRRISVLGLLVFAVGCTNDGPSSVTSPANDVGEVTTQIQPHGSGLQIAATCTPALTITEGNLSPGGLTEFLVTSGPGSITVDPNNNGTGLRIKPRRDLRLSSAGRGWPAFCVHLRS